VKGREVLSLAKGLQFHTTSNATDVTEPAGSVLPACIVLEPNYPNPFNAQTQIRFDLPSAQQLTVTVFSPDGRLVRRLAEGFYPTGSQRVFWDGSGDDGLSVPSGIYLCVLQTKDGLLGRKLTLMK
jgi:hypothetical protein